MNRWTGLSRWIVIAGMVLSGLTNPPARVLAGGWGVTTLESLPEQIVAGQPFEIRFVVRQHGQTLVTDFSPSFEISKVGTNTRLPAVTAVYSRTLQRYTATISIPTAGQWHWELTSFPPQKLPMLTVVNASEARTAVKVNPVSRGQDLFIAKGCAMCHQHGAVPDSGEFSQAYGATGTPALNSIAYSVEYLNLWLKNPKSMKPAAMMPKLELSNADIQSLVAFLMAPKPVKRLASQIVTPPPKTVPRAPTAASKIAQP